MQEKENIVNNEEQEHKPDVWKSYTTVILGGLTHLILGNSITWLYLSYYYTDNFHIDDKNEVSLLTKIFTSLVITFYSLTNFLQSIFNKYKNVRIYLILTYVLLLATYLILNQYADKKIFYLMGIMYGISLGISYYPLLQNATYHFIKLKKRIILFYIICFNISPCVFYFLNRKFKSKELNIYISLGIGILSFFLSYDYLSEYYPYIENTEEKRFINNELEYNSEELLESDRNSTDSKTSSKTDAFNERRPTQVFKSNEIVKYLYNPKIKNISFIFKNNRIYYISLFYFIFTFIAVKNVYDINFEYIGSFLIASSLIKIILHIISNIFNENKFIFHILSVAAIILQLLIYFDHSFGKKEFMEIKIISKGYIYSFVDFSVFFLINKIYGNENNKLISNGIVVFCSLTKLLVVLLYDKTLNKYINLCLVIIAGVLLSFINLKQFNYKRDSSQEEGIELEEQNDDEDRLAIDDVKSDID